VAYITENSVLKFRLREDTHEQKMLEDYALQNNSHLTSTDEKAAVDARRSYEKAAVDTHTKAAAAKAEIARKLLQKIDKKISMTRDMVEHLEEERAAAVDSAADARHA
jgi:ribosomal protein S11